MSDDWYESFFSGLTLELWEQAIAPEATGAEAEFLMAELALGRGARVLDVPCGQGRLALALARRGCRVTGVDIAAECIAAGERAAAAEGLAIAWHRADMRRELPAGPFDAAFCFGNSFGYFDRPGMRDFLAALARAVRPGGRLAVDTAMAAESLLPGLDERMWVPVGDLLLLVEHHYDAAASRLDTDYTIVRGAERVTRRASHWIFTAGEIVQMLGQAGFATLASYSDLERDSFGYGSPRLLLVAERAGE